MIYIFYFELSLTFSIGKISLRWMMVLNLCIDDYKALKIQIFR